MMSNTNSETNPDPSVSKEEAPQTVPVEDVNEAVEEYSEEYDHLNSTLDQLDSCLDAIEKQNDDLYTQLQELLQSSREAREGLQIENGQSEEEGAAPADGKDSETDRTNDVDHH